MTKKDKIRIGNAGGYWGDDPDALQRQIEGGHLDFVTMDFLAEVTMSIMQKQRHRDPQLGYARDFIPMIKKVLPKCLEQGTTIITNAGGVNPSACCAAIMAAAAEVGCKPKIAVVHGDDILEQISDLRGKGAALANMEDGRGFDEVADHIESANIYFGAAPVVDALAKWDPDIIITGRVTDTGITLAPMIHNFGWSTKDWHKLAAGTVAAHILECGSQSTGGNFTDWHKVPSFDNMGFPIVEVEASGEFTVTKHPGTGGLVSVDTVREQLFYEMGAAHAYITPDVVADFTTIQLAEAGPDRVRVTGVQGAEPTPLYKVSMAYRDGFKAIGEIAISGPDARAKAEAFAKIFWHRAGDDFAETSTEYYGWNACHRSLGGESDGNEIILRLGARDHDKSKLRRFGKLVPSLILAGPPGVCVLGGVPRAQEVVSYWPALLDKTLVKPRMGVWDGKQLADDQETSGGEVGNFTPGKGPAEQSASTASCKVTDAINQTGTALRQICLARSGDKGDTANIGVMARSQAAYDYLREHLTAQVVKDWFQELCSGKVTRHELPNMQGFNFLLEDSLGGGGTLTLRTDAQGKTFAQAMLRQKMNVPGDVLATCEEA